MSRDEFESQPGMMFHGNPTGNFNVEHRQAPYGFHVGSRQAAEEAVNARAGYGRYSDASPIPAPLRAQKKETKGVDGFTTVSHKTHSEAVRGGRVVSPMVNAPTALGTYGRGALGDMDNSGDVAANAKAREIHTKGQKMRRGIFYKNASEDAGSVSAVIPGRASFKTHEDHLVEARAAGKVIPKRAMKGYKEIPGQQRLF